MISLDTVYIYIYVLKANSAKVAKAAFAHFRSFTISFNHRSSSFPTRCLQGLGFGQDIIIRVEIISKSINVCKDVI